MTSTQEKLIMQSSLDVETLLKIIYDTAITDVAAFCKNFDAGKFALVNCFELCDENIAAIEKAFELFEMTLKEGEISDSRAYMLILEKSEILSSSEGEYTVFRLKYLSRYLVVVADYTHNVDSIASISSSDEESLENYESEIQFM